METRAKRQGLKITLLVLLIVTVIAAIIVGVMLSAERELEDLRNDMLLELEAKKGEYDEQSIVLCNTSVSEAKAIAEKIGAKLRITSNGSFATLTLTDGRTIRDVYADDAYKQYLRAFSADYHSSVSELEEKLPVMPTVGNASEMGDHLGYMGIAGLWSSNTGKGITVAVIDTGIDTDNAEFTGRISEYSYNATFDKIVKDYTLENGEYDWSLVEDEHGHGTAVTGALAAANDGSGVVGVAPSVTVIVIKAECDENGRFERTSDLVFGLYYAIERDVSVVNMSFGTYSLTNPFAAATKLAYDSDVLCVAAAGNEGTASLSWPAADEYVIGVGALSEDSWALASYSNYGDNVDICAPGAVYTTSLGGEYKTETGTSLSSPLVAGALALLSYKDKYITFDRAYTLLTASSYDLGELGEDWYFGFGAIDTYALVSETRGTITYDMMTDELEDESGIFIVNHTLQRMLEPRRLYSVFDGWYYDPHYVEEFNYYEDTVTASEITLYAKWVSEADGIPYTYRELDDGTIEITSYTGRRRFISIPEYIDGKLVTSIGNGAFMGESDLREINMPFGINNIGTAAFKDCSSLTKIEIPERVVSIGKEAFYNNVRLSSVAFLGSPALERIGSEAFAHCSSLTRIEIPEKVVSLDGSAFYGATSLYSIAVNRFNNSYKSVDGVLFNASGSTLLAYPAGITGNYTVPEGVTAIGNHAFAFTLAGGVELGEIQVIGSYAFSNSALTAVAIPDTVYSLGAYAFSGSGYLSTATLGTGLSTVPESAFAFCSELTEIVLPSAIREIKANAFVNSGIRRVSFSEDGALYYIGAAAFANTPVTELRFPVSLRLIYENAFSGCTDLASVSFADESDIDAIGVRAFENTVSLTAVTLPDGLEELGDYAFSGSALTGNVDIPASLTYLGKGAFAHCASLETITVNEENTTYKSVDGVVYTEDGATLVAYPSGSKATSYALLTDTKAVGGAAIVGAVSLKALTLNSGLTELSELAISNNPAITSLSIPDSVTLISRFALANNPKMTSISFGTNSELDRLGYGALAYTSITSLTIPKNVSTIAQGAFFGSSKLTSITFANDSKLEAVAAYTFDGCTALRSITFNSGSALKNIEAHGFEGLTALTSVSFGNAPLTNIDNFAFRFCDSLTSITIPEGVKSIGRYAFYACYALNTVNIPASVEHIGSFAFLGSKTLEVYFASENLPLYLDEDWDHGIKAYYLGVSEVLTEGNITYAKLTDGSIAILKFEVDPEDNIVDLNDYLYLGDITVIGSGAFAYTELYDIYFPETLRVIQKEAFMGTDVYFVELPASVEFIGSYAFADCPVEEIMFAENSSLKTIEQSAFENTAICVEVVIPASVENLGRAIFRGSSVPAVSFEDGSNITAIPEEMFANSGLEEIALPESVTKICDGAFMGTAQLISFAFTNTTDELWLGANAFYQSGISSIEIPANLTVIEEFALVALTNMTSFAVDEANPYYASLDGVLYTKDLSKIVSVPAGMTGSFTLPLSVEKIGFGAFEGTVLESVIFPEGINLLSIGNRAFFGAKNLSEIEIPASVVAIDYYAFAYAKNLERVTFEAGSRLTGIYEGAFYGCASLSDIIIPDGVVEISDFAFYGADALKSFPVGENTSLRMLGSYAFAYTGLSGEFTLPASVTDLGSYAFLGTDFKKVTIPADNREDLIIGLGAFGENNSLESLVIPFIGESKNTKTNTFLGFIFGAGKYTANATYVPESLKKVVINSDITAVPQYAFYELAGLEEVELPESVNSVYYYAFYNTPARYELKQAVSLWMIDIYENNIAVTTASSSDFGKGISGHLELAESVTSIGSSAFRDCSSLVSIVIPEGVTSIGNSAFYDCSSLTSITIPEGVTSIGSYAFRYCSSLTSIDIPESVTGIGNQAFGGCSLLTSITIPESVTSISEGVFTGCYSLTSVTIPEGVTSIGRSAFYGCSSLYKVVNNSDIDLTIGSTDNGYLAYFAKVIIDKNGNKIYKSGYDGFEYIDTADGFRFMVENGAYKLTAYLGDEDTVTLPTDINGNSYEIYEMRGVKNVIIPDGVTTIGKYAFYNCRSLTSVVIPNSVKSIDSNAFEGCSSLTSIEIPSGVISIGYYAFGNCTSLKNVTMHHGVSSIGDSAFFNTSIEKFVLPNSLVGLSPRVFSSCKSLKSVVIPDSVKYIGIQSFSGCRSLESVNIPNSVTSIGIYAFEGCSSLTQAALPAYLERIGEGAFENTAITEVHIPASVTSIGSAAFAGCNIRSFTIDEANKYFTEIDGVIYNQAVTRIVYVPNNIIEVVVPSTVNDISSAFADCANLKTVSFDKESSINRIGRNAFARCTSLQSVVIPDGVTAIEQSAFYHCNSLVNVVIPSSVTTIDGVAFSGCISLKNVILPQSVTYIGGQAFYGCDSLASIVIPESVSLIDDGAFYGCSMLKSVQILGSSIVVGENAFRDCASLNSVIMSGGITEIGSSAFSSCRSLTSLAIPHGITSINSHVFSGCSSLTNIEIPDSVTSIGNAAFYGCSSLTSIVIPKGVTKIDSDAFYSCNSLYEVINNSDLELTLGSSDNGYLAYYTRVLISKDGSKTYKSGYDGFEYIDTADGFRFIEENGVYKLIAYLGDEDTVTLPSDINGTNYEIYQMRGVKNVIVPESVTSIGNNAFNGCESLQSITIPESVTSIGDYAFDNCISLTSVGISYGVESIGSRAFYCCISLKNIIIPDSVNSIGSWAFNNCTSLTSIIIPGNVNSVGDRVFYNCSSLASVGISYGVTSIGSSAFSNCTSLTNIVIPMSVTSIGSSAFMNTAYYNDSANWVNGALYIDGHLISVAEGTKCFEVKEGTYSIASDAFTNCKTTIKHLTLGGNHQSLLSSLTNLETLVITELPTSHYIYCYFGYNTASIPQTLNRIVLKDGVKLSATNSYTRKPFYGMTGVTIYVEANEKDVRWDANFDGWSNGNTVVYGDKWISADFYDHEGNILSKEIFSTSQVIRIPYLKVDGNVQYSYIVDGFDIDGDGIVDVIPATSTTDISASAVVREVVNKYKVTVYDKDGETVIYEAELPYGTEITLPDPDEKRGYDFVGFIGFEDGMTVGGDVSFTANYDHVGDGHEYGEPVWVDPTCTDEGGYKHECTLCGEWYLTDTVPAAGHSYALTVIAPTCTERGYNLYVCSCGDEYRDTYTDPKGHEWGAWVETLAPTCTEDGEETHSCTDCDAVETRRVDCKGHNDVHIGSTAPTCGSNGGQTYKCLECGRIYNDESLPAHGHNYKAQRIDVEDLNWLLNHYNNRIKYEKPARGSRYTYYVCSGCKGIELIDGDTLYTGAAVKSVCEHTAGEWGTFLPPTYLDGGIDIQTCTKCGYLLDAVATDPKELSADFKFSGIALNLTEDINLIYTVSIPEGYEAPYMVFLFNGVEYTVTDYTVRADGKYTFKFSGINPQCMGDNVCATLYANVEGELVSICYAEYSVLKYCKTLLEHPTYGSNEKIVTLISDLLTYGANTQIYRKYKADALVTDGLALTPSVYNNVAENKTKVSGTAAEGLAWRGTGLYLTNAMSVYFTFTAEDTEDLAIAMKIGTRTTTVKVSDLKPDANGRYTVHLYNVMAHEFDKEITASFVRGGVEVGQTLTYSVNSYVISAEGYITDETLAALIKSIYNYGVAVEAYRG